MLTSDTSIKTQLPKIHSAKNQRRVHRGIGVAGVMGMCVKVCGDHVYSITQ